MAPALDSSRAVPFQATSTTPVRKGARLDYEVTNRGGGYAASVERGLGTLKIRTRQEHHTRHLGLFWASCLARRAGSRHRTRSKPLGVRRPEPNLEALPCYVHECTARALAAVRNRRRKRGFQHSAVHHEHILKPWPPALTGRSTRSSSLRLLFGHRSLTGQTVTPQPSL